MTKSGIPVTTSAGAKEMRAAIFILLFCPVCLCQDSRNLGDSFANAAFIAVEGVKSFIYSPNGNAPAKVLSAQKDKMDKANNEATTAAEIAVNEALKQLLKQKMDNNSRREMMTAQKERQLLNRQKNDPLPIPVYEEPEYISMTKKEDTCFTAFERNLRNQSAAVPIECNSIAGK